MTLHIFTYFYVFLRIFTYFYVCLHVWLIMIFLIFLSPTDFFDFFSVDFVFIRTDH